MSTKHSGFLIQSNNGEKGNFELVKPSLLGGMVHCWRNNDDSLLPWIGPHPFGSSDVSEVSLIQSNFGDEKGHLEVVARVNDRIELYWRDDTPPWTWHGPTPVITNVTGNPALIQSRHGEKGNFELVAPLPNGGLVHFWRDNDTSGLPWIGPHVFGSPERFEAVALIQSNFGDYKGHLEVIARTGNRLVHFWRDDTGPWAWHGPTTVISEVKGIPALIQSRHGERGNFELVSPLANGGLVHFWRDNDASGFPWIGPHFFGGTEHFEAVALIQSNFGGEKGHLEVVARRGNTLEHFWRDDTGPWAWHATGRVSCGDSRCSPEREGEWRVRYSTGVVGIHAALLNTGHVLYFSYREGDHEHGEAAVLNLQSGVVNDVDPDRNLFCSGHAFRSDGQLFVAGGAVSGLRSRHTFTPIGTGGMWLNLAEMLDGRWYPTCTTLPDGRIFVISGTRPGGPVSLSDLGSMNATYEIFPNPGPRSPIPIPFLLGLVPYALYPFVFVLPSGKLFIHAKNETRFLDLANLSTGLLDSTVLHTRRREPRTYPLQGTSVLLPLLPTSTPPYRARVMLIGGGGEPPGQTTPATDRCEILDLSESSPAWHDVRQMPHARVMPDSVLLPDGKVLVINGSSKGKADDGIDPVFPADLYDPEKDEWQTLCAMRVPRLYHSTALLLPDGSVITAGKDKEFNPDEFKYPELRGEVFSPPYLFRGPRPSVTTVPTTIAYGKTFAIETPEPASVKRAALVRAGSVTHSFNMDQRYVGLEIPDRTSSQVHLKAPPNSNVAPPGPYMLFVLNDADVPSIGRFVQLG